VDLPRVDREVDAAQDLAWLLAGRRVHGDVQVADFERAHRDNS
jgi:hypothetical protein